MRLKKEQIQEINQAYEQQHKSSFEHLAGQLDAIGVPVNEIVSKISELQIAVPSWALGAGGTRFGRFAYEGEPANLEQKMEDVGVLHALTASAGAVSLHFPWDKSSDYQSVKQVAKELNLEFDAVNSNTFQDKEYKFGSLCSLDKSVRGRAIDHNLEVINIGEQLGSKALTIWLADGSNFPGQQNFQTALSHTSKSLQGIYAGMPSDWKMLIEYKPYEPNFYSTVIPDWGTSYMLATECGERAHTLVDLGHHLPNTNIEQIVASLLYKGRLGGFHFNDSKYGDDDLTVGSIKPYSLFLIFNELVYGMANNPSNPDISWMIDASHNVKDPLEDLLQSLDAIKIAYAQALLIDQNALAEARAVNDVAMCQEILQNAFRTDVRPLIAQSRQDNSAALNPIACYRQLEVRKNLINERGKDSRATGL